LAELEDWERERGAPKSSGRVRSREEAREPDLRPPPAVEVLSRDSVRHIPEPKVRRSSREDPKRASMGAEDGSLDEVEAIGEEEEEVRGLRRARRARPRTLVGSTGVAGVLSGGRAEVTG
jgi:hypothetical protein